MRRPRVTLVLLLLASVSTLWVAPAAVAAVPQRSTVRSPDAERLQDERTAVRAVDGFWRGYFARIDQPYRPPRVLGGYVGTDGPLCGGEPSVPGNAFYCLPGDYLAWDEQLMTGGYREIGDAWVYMVIAHEWGHAIQARLERSQVSVAAELQADCLAGAALQGAADAGALQFEDGDKQEVVRTLVAVADDYPWTDPSSHGNAQERMSAYDSGAQHGVDGCL